MKKVILALIATLTVIPAQARSMRTQYTAPLTAFNFQEGTFLAEQNFDLGTVSINFVKQEIKLTLTESSDCPKNAFCLTVMPRKNVYTAKLIKSYTSSCKNVIYSAETNNLLVDGLRTKIQVIDSERSICPSLMHRLVEPVAVKMQLTFPRAKKSEYHTFTAEYFN